MAPIGGSFFLRERFWRKMSVGGINRTKGGPPSIPGSGSGPAKLWGLGGGGVRLGWLGCGVWLEVHKGEL